MSAARSGPSWLREHVVLIAGLAVLVYTFLPIFVVVLMSFNKLPSEQTKIYEFSSFTLDNWLNPCADPSMCDAVVRSLQIGGLSTLVSTVLGTLMAFALVRHDFLGRSSMNLLIFLPMASPEIVMGSSLLALFVAAGFAGQLGFWTILIAHIMFCLSFVVVTVRARLAGLDDNLEQAAMDLYGTPWRVFRRITLPQLWPGILAGAMLAFVISLDDVVITEFVKSAGQDTLPTYMLGQMRRVVTPEVNAISTVLLAISVVMVVAFYFLSRTKKQPTGG